MKFRNNFPSVTAVLFHSFILFGVIFPVKTPASESDKVNNPGSSASYAIELHKDSEKPVSDLLMGFNVVYPHEKDGIWEDGKLANLLNDLDVGFIRYPGGTVSSYYHWDALTGHGWVDGWDPGNPVEPKPDSQFMDIDEYMDLIKKTGATPLVGVNVSSGRRWNREQDGIDEAIALMKYCKDKNFKVEYWYLDNEPYMHDSNGGSKTPEEYARLINAYAPVMKAFDPNIKIVANWNAGFRNKGQEYERLIALAGKNIDVLDVHWYWSWSDTSWEKWFVKTPLVQWTGYSYENEIAYFRKMIRELGYPNIKIASFEWNTGPISAGNSLTASRAAFVQTEMMMQFIRGGLDYAVFWPIHWPSQSAIPRSFYNTRSKTANPVIHMFKFLSEMQGGHSIEYSTGVDHEKMYSVAVRDKKDKLVRLCIVNKNDHPVKTEIKISDLNIEKAEFAKQYTVNEDGSKYFLKDVDCKILKESESVELLTEGVSITMLIFNTK